MSNERARMQILEMIETGKVSASEGLQLLESLNGESNSEPALLAEDLAENLEDFSEAAASGAVDFPGPKESGFGEAAGPTPADSQQADAPDQKFGGPEVIAARREFTIPPGMARWRRWWLLPFWFGVGTTILGGLFMYLALIARGVSFWLVLASLPFIVGLIFTVLAWQARNARWLHLRVDNIKGSGPSRIAFSFPLPLRTASWAMRIFGHKIPHMQGVSVDEILNALDTSASADNPLYIAVNDDEDGERVEIYIG